jgi:arginine-tRNA-protein transferase
MFAQVEHPKALSAVDLDDYLSKGWFRLGQTIFTTNFLQFHRKFYSAIWLRVDLQRFFHDSISQKLFKRNSIFEIKIQPATLTREKEKLFALYRENVSFEASTSLIHLLFGKVDYNVFHTYEVTIHDKDKLIGVGFFDLGIGSAAGISSFYDPDYKKFSLGKFLIYCKILYCKEIGLEYFYPGYFVPGYAPFDYKLGIAKSALHYLDVANEKWKKIDEFSLEAAPINVMLSKLHQLQKLLSSSEIHGVVYRYEFFDANLIPDLKGMTFFDFPVFLTWSDGNNTEIKPIVAYDIRTMKYHILQCVVVWKPDERVDDDQEGIFASYLLKMSNELYASESVDEVKIKLLILNRNFKQSGTSYIKGL